MRREERAYPRVADVYVRITHYATVVAQFASTLTPAARERGTERGPEPDTVLGAGWATDTYAQAIAFASPVVLEQFRVFARMVNEILNTLDLITNARALVVIAAEAKGDLTAAEREVGAMLGMLDRQVYDASRAGTELTKAINNELRADHSATSDRAWRTSISRNAR